jgi:hypothetical protein
MKRMLYRFSMLRFALCAAILGLIVPAAHAAAPVLPACAWPLVTNGENFLNVATPDTNRTYWVMPIDLQRWQSVIFRGIYPHARAFNLTSYTATGDLIGTISDAQIRPDAGSVNPFTAPSPNTPQTYTITANGIGGGGNSLAVGGGGLVFVIYRVIAPNQGLDRAGGVSLPSVTVRGVGGTQQLQPCPFMQAELSLGAMIPILAASGYTEAANFLSTILTAANQRSTLGSPCTPRQPAGSNVVPFGPAPAANFFADPPTVYLQTPNYCLQPQRIMVIRGRGLVYPNTYFGGSVFDPAFDGSVQVRYWSMCNNDGVIPYPVIACQADFETKLDQGQSYTYVISEDPAPPSWLPKYATWLPWGPPNVPITVIFRVIPSDNTPIPAGYEPQGVICDQSLFEASGVEGCFTAAGLSAVAGQ